MAKLKESGMREESGQGLTGKEIEKAREKRRKAELRRLRNLLRDCLSSLKDLRNSNAYVFIQSPDYLALHQYLLYSVSHSLSEVQKPKENRFNSYYWETPENKDAGIALVSEYNREEYPTFPGKIELWTGPLSRLDHGLRALIVDQVYAAYAHELIKVEEAATTYIDQHYPHLKETRRAQAIVKYQRELEARLLLDICHSYREDYVVAIAVGTLDSDPETQYLLGSIGAAQGQAGQPFWPAARNAPDFNQESSLATQNLLRYDLKQEFAHLADLSERLFVEITRLHTVPPNEQLHFDAEVRQKVSQALMYFIHLGVQRNFSSAIYEICNTRLALHRWMKQNGLGVDVLSQPDTLSVNPTVLESSVGNYFKHNVSVPQILHVNDSASVAGVSFVQIP